VSRVVTCPRCKHRLAVAADAAGMWLTCPRCLASVANPNLLAVPTEPADVASRDGDRPAPPPRRPPDECPSCGRRVEPGWRSCPWCEQPLDRPARRPRLRSADDDLRLDTAGATAGLTVLIVFCVLGLVSLLVLGGPFLREPGAGGYFAVGIVGLLVLGVGCGVAASRGGAGGTTAAVLGSVGVCALVLMTLFMMFVATCKCP
jgi:hypothetical protein